MRHPCFAALILALVAACSGSDAGVPAAAGTDSGTPAGDGGPAGDDGGTLTDAASDAPPPDGGPGDAGGDAGTWTPKRLNGLSLWLDDGVGIVKDPAAAGRVKRWLDQSGLANHADAAGGDGVTSTPKLSPSALGAGLDAVECDAQTYLSIPSTPSLRFGTGDFGIVMVAKAVALGTLYSKVSPEGLSLNLTAESTLQLQAVGVGGGIALLAGAPTSTFALFVARGSALRLRFNSTTVTGATSTADLSGANAPVILCQSSITQKIAIAEVIAVKGTLTDAELLKTVTYLNTKFGGL